MRSRPQPPRPDRLRTVEQPFGWIPFRVLSSGLLLELDSCSKLLYFFLCLVADRHGVSFWSDRRVAEVLRFESEDLKQARAQLIGLDLLAVDRQVSQLLSLPSQLRGQPVVGRGRRTRGDTGRGGGLCRVGSVIGELFGEL